MAEYIKREAAIKATCENCTEQNICGGSCDDTDRLRVIPAADVVARDCYDRLLAENDELRKECPVVRCGECAYCEWKNEVCTYGWCKRISTYKMRDEYCSDGERRDGERRDGERRDGDGHG